ncbi:hypothetical protein CVT24_008627 [Panaeolus cyanescens]|uniref:Uncharacterized protein n=1 Tax=Panaeolus cyanescens TaxID=181874 RepID=A0A409VEE2_9AGAR|nr:hypothetical protein CVT24_008627 [Panaeolus cyanescens]
MKVLSILTAISALTLTSVDAIALTFYRINAPPVETPTTTTSPAPSFSIEKQGTTLYTAINPGSSGMVPWQVKEIADKVIIHMPSTTVTLNQPTTRVYTVTQGSYIELANIPPVEGPLFTPTSGPVATLYEYGFNRYCNINQSGGYGACHETVVKPRVAPAASPTQPPTEEVATRIYTGSLIPVTTIYTSFSS